MKLVNPTDEELNAAFAEKVCGWYRTDRKDASGNIWVNEDGEEMFDYVDVKTALQPKDFGFTTSADAVLPWLEKFDGHTNGPEINFYSGSWEVIVNGCTTRDRAVDGRLPRACVIALLRAHGVTVELP